MFRPFCEKNAIVSDQHTISSPHIHSRSFFFRHRAFTLDPAPSAFAKLQYRTFGAAWRFAAHQGTQFHKSLVVKPCVTARQYPHGLFRYDAGCLFSSGGFVQIQQTGEDAFYVSIHTQHILIEGNGKDGRHRIRSQSGQGRQRFFTIRDVTVMTFHHDFCGRLHKSGATVIPQTFPRLEYIFLELPQQPQHRENVPSSVGNNVRPVPSGFAGA